MKDNNLHEKHYIVKSNDINKYISLKCESLNNSKKGLKIVIYIKDIPLISIPGTKFPSLEELYQGKESDLKNNEKKRQIKRIITIYEQLRSDLILWSENYYNINFLDYKIAFPLLKELRRVGGTKFQIIFQQEILTQYATENIEVKKFLKREGYLQLIGDFF